jgi:GT2 family glycosyltransferase
MVSNISFVSVLYNHSESLVQRCVDSIHNVMQYCPYFKYDIILVNNLNTKKYNLIGSHTLIEQLNNTGYCGGNNLGIKNSKSEYIIILNPDIKLLNSLCIDWLISNCKINNSISGRLVGANDWYTYASSFPTDKKYEELPFYFNEPTLIKDGNWKSFKYIDGCLMAFAKSIWEDIGGFDETIFPGYFGENTFAFKSYLKYNKFILSNVKIDSTYIHSDNDSTFNNITDIIKWTKDSRNLFYTTYALTNWDKFINYLNL